MQSIQNITALSFLVVLAVLAGVSILGIWDMLGEDVVQKSFFTLCLIGVVSGVVLVAAKYFHHPESGENEKVVAPDPMFRHIRVFTVAALIVSSALLALLGVFAIWEVMDMDVLFRSLASLGVIAFSAMVSIVICMDREGLKSVVSKNQSSAGTVIGILFLFWFMWVLVSSF